MLAALYIDARRGPYPALGVDCWGAELPPLPSERPTAQGRVEQLAKTQRHLTPPGFASWLLAARPLHTCTEP